MACKQACCFCDRVVIKSVQTGNWHVVQGAVAPMFPDEDEWAGVEWDEYGAALDLSKFAAHDADAAGEPV